MIHNKFRYILTLVALLAVTTGAWAQGYNVTFGGFAESEMNTTVNVASLPQTFTQIGNDAFYPWTVISTSGNMFYGATVTSGGEGKVSVSVPNYEEMSITVSGPFEGTATIHVTGEDDENRDISCDITVSCEAVGGAASAVTVAWDKASKTGTFTMPGSDVVLIPEYYPGMLTLPASLTGGKLEVVGMTAPFTKLEVLDAWEGDNTLLSADHLPGLKEMTDAEAENWTDVPSGYVILIYGFDGTKAKMATYIDGELTFPSTEEVTLSQLKTASADAELYYSSEAQMPEGFDTDGTNYYVADKTEFKVKATPADGFRLVSLMFGETDVTDQVDADGIATLTMPEGDADITLTATFSDQFDLAFQAANANTIESGKATVKVGDTDKTADIQDGKLSVKYGQTVTLTATQGYKFRKVEVKKGGAAAAKTIIIGDMELTYADGDTWETIVSKNSDKIKILSNRIVQVAQPAPDTYRYLHVWYTNVKPSDIIDPSKNYQWGTLEVNY